MEGKKVKFFFIDIICISEYYSIAANARKCESEKNLPNTYAHKF
jgi:hypothetical protein